ncbi:hypothetical protein [Streptomyces sp. NPDC058371]|jgi:hypothetical protein|uniref:hypothetical protein n=1 Tax=Streptomyces sp. NPDC058371 TaxID=3346463 RepID=UPI0036501E69
MTTAQQPVIPSTANPRPAHRALSLWAGWGLGLLVPTVVLAWIAVLSGERGTNCLMYGEECSPVPGSLLYGCFWTALAAGVLALALPRTRSTWARSGTVLLQWGAQLTLGALILSGA